MKSFFKKLAFVMALAMVVSLAAPAAKTAVAAEEKKPLGITYQGDKTYTISEVNLAKVGATEDLRFLYAPDNWKELGVNWSSSNENVVTVDDGGVVTGIAAGKADVTVAIGTESATVTVYVEDTQTYTAKMGTDAENLITEWTLEEAGDTIDLAFFGIKDYARDDYSGNGTPRYFCEWDTTDPEVATVDNKGLVTAVAPGKAKITLIVWNLKLGTKHNVDACWITVPEAEPEATPAPAMTVINEFAEKMEYANTKVNTTQNTVVIKFSEAVEIKPEDVTVFAVYDAYDDKEGVGQFTDDIIEDGFEEQYVKTVVADATKTLYTITMLEDFKDDVTYDIRVGNEDDPDYREWFKASVGPVAKVIVNGDGAAALADDEQALLAVPETLSVKLYDAEGVNVTERKVDGLKNNDIANISYEFQNEGDFVFTDYNKIEFYAKDTAVVKAKYDNYDVEEAVYSAAYNVTPKASNPYGVKKVIDWTIIKDDGKEKPDWSAPVKEIPASETGYVVVTLLQDSRDQYYCTHIMGTKDKYNGKEVWFTEDETKPFWLNGLYVEYKAMDEDMMLIETDGEVASFEIEGQKNTRARFALYLYNQNYYGTKEFIEEQHTEYVTICHPRQLAGISVDKTTVDLMKHTEEEACVTCQAATGSAAVVEDAFYTEFSKKDVTVTLNDIHTGKADYEDAITADFSLKLLTDTDNVALQNLIYRYEILLNYGYSNAVERKFTIELRDFVEKEVDEDNRVVYDENGNAVLKLVEVKNKLTGEKEMDYKYITDKSQIKFRITEETTNKSVVITVNLKELVEEKVVDSVTGKAIVSDVDLIEEFVDEMKSKQYFEKFAVDCKKQITVEQQITDYKNDKSIDGYEIKLLQMDKAGNEIGYDSNLYVTNVDIRNDAKPHFTTLRYFTANNHDEDAAVTVGDRVMILVDKSGKVLPIIDYSWYKNPEYKEFAAGYGYLAAPYGTYDIGVEIKAAGSATNAALDASTAYTQYGIKFRTVGDDNEVIYAKEGTYTAIIRTIESIDEKGYVTFASATGLNDKVVFTVVNSNPDVYYNGRDLSFKDAPLTNYITDGEIRTAQIGDDAAVKELILEAFNFKIGNDAWGEKWENDYTVSGTGDLDASDILYYTYTLAPSNNQININSVTFKVPVMGVDNSKDDAKRYGWYRSTATVNKSITFED